MEVNFVLIKIVKKKNSSVNFRFKIFVVAFRARKLFGTFEKRAPGHSSFTGSFILAVNIERLLASL